MNAGGLAAFIDCVVISPLPPSFVKVQNSCRKGDIVFWKARRKKANGDCVFGGRTKRRPASVLTWYFILRFGVSNQTRSLGSPEILVGHPGFQGMYRHI